MLSIVLLLTALVSAQCPNGIDLRYEWDDLPYDQQGVFLDTMWEFYASGAYDAFSRTHNDRFREIHNNPYFLPVHRCMLLSLHAALKQINPAVPLPYWDSSLDASNIATAPLWNDFALQDDSSCVYDAINDPTLTLNYPDGDPHCLRRNYHAGVFDYQLDPIQIGNFIRGATSYDQFRQQIEYKPHPYVHLGVGGDPNAQDMASNFSPNDPIFYLHHGWIDKLWSNFQSSASWKKYAFNGVDAFGRPVTTSYVLPFCGATVQQMFDTKANCYAYMPPGSTFVGINTNSPLKKRQVNGTASSTAASGTTKNGFKRGSQRIAPQKPKNERLKDNLTPVRPVLDDHSLAMLQLDKPTAYQVQNEYEKNYKDCEHKLQKGQKVFGPDKDEKGNLNEKDQEIRQKIHLVAEAKDD